MNNRARRTQTFLFGLIAALTLSPLHGACLAQTAKGARAAAPAGQGMQKVVTQRASFVLYVPKGWKAQETADGKALQVTAADPSGRSSVFFSTGTSQGGNVSALAKREASKLGRAAGDRGGLAKLDRCISGITALQ